MKIETLKREMNFVARVINSVPDEDVKKDMEKISAIVRDECDELIWIACEYSTHLYRLEGAADPEEYLDNIKSYSPNAMVFMIKHQNGEFDLKPISWMEAYKANSAKKKYALVFTRKDGSKKATVVNIKNEFKAKKYAESSAFVYDAVSFEVKEVI